MAERDPVQPGRRRLPWGLALALALTVPGCGSRDDPQVAVSELSWACGAARCTASFRLTAARDGGAVVVLVRAYDGDSVQQRAIVGEHRELLALADGQSRHVTVALDTERPANRVRVIVEPAR